MNMQPVHSVVYFKEMYRFSSKLEFVLPSALNGRQSQNYRILRIPPFIGTVKHQASNSAVLHNNGISAIR